MRRDVMAVCVAIAVSVASRAVAQEHGTPVGAQAVSSKEVVKQAASDSASESSATKTVSPASAAVSGERTKTPPSPNVRPSQVRKSSGPTGVAETAEKKAAAASSGASTDLQKKGPPQPEPSLEEVLTRISALVAQHNASVGDSGKKPEAKNGKPEGRAEQLVTDAPPPAAKKKPTRGVTRKPRGGPPVEQRKVPKTSPGLVTLKWDADLAPGVPAKNMGVRLVWPF